MVNLGFYDYSDLSLGLFCIQKLVERMTVYRCMGLTSGMLKMNAVLVVTGRLINKQGWGYCSKL